MWRSPLALTLLYVAAGFALLAALVFWPPKNGLILVVTHEATSGPALWALLDGTDGRVVDIVGRHLVLVSGTEPDFAARLSRNGALLLLNPSDTYGCSPRQPILFHKGAFDA